jgi:hypothetical protein
MTIAHAYFGDLTPTAGELRWSAHLDLDGRRVPVELSAAPDIDVAALDAAAQIPKALSKYDTLARAALERDAETEAVSTYAQHHLSELSPSDLERVFGVAPAEVTPARFVTEMYLARVWLHPGGDRLAVLDYTIASGVTDYILAVELDETGEVVEISMES